MQKITRDFINAGRNKNGNLTPGQIRLLTGKWAPPKGWEESLIGTEIDDRIARLFLTHIQPPPPRHKTASSTLSRSDYRASLMRTYGIKSTRGLCK